MNEKAVISEESVAREHFYNAKFHMICGLIVLIRNVSIYSFCAFFSKLKASGVSLGSRRQGYELNILENWRIRRSLLRSAKPAPFTIMLSFIGGMWAYCPYTKRIDFCGWFLKNKRVLELVWGPASSAYTKRIDFLFFCGFF